MDIQRCSQLYMGESLGGKEEQLWNRLVAGKPLLGIYLLVMEREGQNRLEFLDSTYLLQEMYPQKPLFLIGMAGGYIEAQELVELILKEVYETTGDADIRAYLLERENRQERI